MVSTNAAASEPRVRTSWAARRRERGAKASTRTPTTAAPKTTSIGESWPYSMCGAGIAPLVDALLTDAASAAGRTPVTVRFSLVHGGGIDRSGADPGRGMRGHRIRLVLLRHRHAHGGVDDVQHRLGIDADEDDQREQRRDGGLSRPAVLHPRDLVTDRPPIAHWYVHRM